MKVVLSKKGVDSSNCSNPVKAKSGEELLFVPIPSLKEKVGYEDIKYSKDKTMFDKAKENIKNCKFLMKVPIECLNKELKVGCHLDPQLKNYYGNDNFLASFGQVEKAQKYLENNEIGVGDLFLFYGWFYDEKAHKDKHIIWGYMQVGDVLTFNEDGTVNSCKQERDKKLTREDVEKEYQFLKNQPHWENTENYPFKRNNTIYIAKKYFNDDEKSNIKGYGVFKYNEKLALTDSNADRKSDWCVPNLANVKIMKSSGKENDHYSFDSDGRINIAKGYGQEFVLVERSDEVLSWAKWLLELEKV